MSTNDFEKINNQFIDINFEEQSIIKCINEIKDYEKYFGKIKKEELIELLNGQ